MSKVIALIPLGFVGADGAARASPIRMAIGNAAAVKPSTLRRLIERASVLARSAFMFDALVEGGGRSHPLCSVRGWGEGRGPGSPSRGERRHQARSIPPTRTRRFARRSEDHRGLFRTASTGPAC